jgi:hypothetical protein
MRSASWILLAVLGALTLVGSLASLWTAYAGGQDQISAGVDIGDVAAWRPDAAVALRGRRGTAASFAAAYAVLLLFVVIGPYRGGETWAWWAILAAALVLALVVAARVPLLGLRPGTGTGLLQLGVTVVALLLDMRRLRAPAA